jgi:hypothetical protein
MPDRDYSLMLPAGRETTINAGEYDRERQQPSYTINISSPYQHQIQTEQFLVPTADSHIWAWRIKNRSAWPAFVIIKVDGRLLRLEDRV